MTKIGLRTPRSAYVSTLDEARACIGEIGFPAILRPSFTMGGAGAAIAYHAREYDRLVLWGLEQSPTSQILIEQSVLGWKEYELEVMRDCADNVVIICSIENFDPMGVHTGDSITVAPAVTLTDREYQRMRDAALAVIREIGVDTGGSNIQFAVNPETGEQIVIEMNPRVSRSSALASKATGFPIAKLAAKLAIGYTLDEINNDITRVTPASFEPTIDYVVVKMPRFTFEKFPSARPILGTQMKSVGEAMAIGRTFREALGKAVRSLETGRAGFDMDTPDDLPELRRLIAQPGPNRIFQLAEAFRRGLTQEEAHHLTHIDPWFLANLAEMIEAEESVRRASSLESLRGNLLELKRNGLSDKRIGDLLNHREVDVRKLRLEAGIRPVYKRVDTCAAEFEAHTPYLYSTYEEECESAPSDRKKVVILGGGPNRIGQGIEFDYCCVHGAMALREEGVETIMVNCNPETVSTDYDTSDRLYFEPLTFEDVAEICDLEKADGVVVQFGGQTPLRLAVPLEKAGIRILGTPADAIDRAEDRERFGELLSKLSLKAPRWGIARTIEEARMVVGEIGYPVMVRPSYVLGGRAMERIYDEASLNDYFHRLLVATGSDSSWMPLLIDEFLDDAIELDVDVVADSSGAVVVGGVMEHIEEAGIHSGDSACSLPPYSVDEEMVGKIKVAATALAKELGVVGLMNMQVAIHDDDVYIIEVKVAAKLMLGKTLAELGVTENPPEHVSVKESVFPFVKFEDVDTILGPEMRSTGEVMGIAADFANAFAKAQIAAGNHLPTGGRAFLSLRDEDKTSALPLARRLNELGFKLTGTHGTARFLRGEGLEVDGINKVLEGHPHCVDAIENGEFTLIVNTTSDAQAIRDSHSLRRAALVCGISYFTTVRAASAALDAISTGRLTEVRSLQSYQRDSHVR
jgi:carbamoyl-phosphate synthase large subunit